MKVCCVSGECRSAELLRCGVTGGAAAFWLCKVLACICVPAFPEVEAAALAWGQSRLSIFLALSGCGERWRWKAATPPHCTGKVGIACVRPFSAPEISCRSGVAGEPGSRNRRGFSGTFCWFFGLSDIEILWICFNLRQQAGSRVARSGLLLWC